MFTRHPRRRTVLAAVPLLALVSCDACRSRPENVVLIFVDTLRVDHVSAFGYARQTTPELEKLAARGVRFDRCVSQAPWTKPSGASILTSLYPTAHTANFQESRLPDGVTTLAEILQARGLTTQAFVSGYFMRSKHGLAQGFADYNEDYVYGRDRPSSVDLTDAALAWLDQHATERFFLLLHYYEPHYNYINHPEYGFGEAETGRVYSDIPIETIREQGSTFTEAELATLVGYYDSEIRLVDDSMARVLARLEELDLSDTTVVLFSADHGEHFGEHGLWGHEQSIYHQLIAVPLVVAGPDIPAGRHVDAVTANIDVAPTILELLGVPVPPAFQGSSLVPVMHGDAGSLPPVQIAETFKEIRQKAVVSERHMLVCNQANRGRPPFELFDLGAQDDRDIAAAEPDIVQRLLAHLIAYEARFSSPGTRPESWKMDADELELLRSLGYVGGAGESIVAGPRVDPETADGRLRVPVGSVRMVLDNFWDLEEEDGRLFVWTRESSTLTVHALEPSARYRVTLEIADTGGNREITVGPSRQDARALPIESGHDVTVPRPVQTDGRGVLELVIGSSTWRPSERQPSATDNRLLGVRLDAVRLEMVAGR